MTDEELKAEQEWLDDLELRHAATGLWVRELIGHVRTLTAKRDELRLILRHDEIEYLRTSGSTRCGSCGHLQMLHIDGFGCDICPFSGPDHCRWF